MHTQSREITSFSQNATTDTDTDTDTIHTSFSLTQPISREHNSPSGNEEQCKLKIYKKHIVLNALETSTASFREPVQLQLYRALGRSSGDSV